jgi:hypothetical protein
VLSPDSAEDLNFPGWDNRKNIIDFIDQYCVQYWGFIQKKPEVRFVEANFFECHKRYLQNIYPNCLSVIVHMMGGGSGFWHGKFDLTNDRLTSVSCNGPR